MTPKRKRQPALLTDSPQNPENDASSSPTNSVVAPTEAAGEPTAPPQPSDWLIEDLVRCGGITVIGGPSGVGKTKFLFQMVEEWHNERPLFGRATHAQPFCLVSCTHSTAAAVESAHAVGACVSEIPIISAVNDAKSISFLAVCELAQKRVPDLRVLFVDGMHSLGCAKSIVDYGTVWELVTGIKRILQRDNLTLVTTGRTAKPNERNSSNPRDRFLGSTAWTEGLAAYIAIEQSRPNDVHDPRRVITVLPANAPPEVFQWRFTADGVMVPVTAMALEQEAPVGGQTVFEVNVGAFPDDHEFDAIELLELGNGLGVCDRTIWRYVNDMIDCGKLVRVSRGRYRVPTEQ